MGKVIIQIDDIKITIETEDKIFEETVLLINSERFVSEKKESAPADTDAERFCY